jgi:hypothetical protein
MLDHAGFGVGRAMPFDIQTVDGLNTAVENK